MQYRNYTYEDMQLYMSPATLVIIQILCQFGISCCLNAELTQFPTYWSLYCFDDFI